jgi:hypothetical protein
LQQEQLQLFVPAVSALCLASRCVALAAAAPSFIMGHDSASAIFMPVADASPCFFIGQESPPQQSQLSQHDAVSLPAASFFFIGHESSLQQPHDIAVWEVVPAAVKAYANTPTANISIAKMLNSIFFFIFIYLVI